MNQLVESNGARWNYRRTCVDVPGRAYAFQLMQGESAALPGVIGFYAESIDDGRQRLSAPRA